MPKKKGHGKVPPWERSCHGAGTVGMGDMGEKIVAQFLEAMKSLSVTIHGRQVEKVTLWTKRFLDWEGRKITALKEPRHIAVKLLADSFGFLPEFRVPQNSDCIDVGSGNGWPGLAFNVVEDTAKVTFLDSRLSVARFLGALCDDKAFSGLSFVRARAEEAGRLDEFRERFDIASSRAMADPFISLEFSGPFVKPGGACILWLGPEEEERLFELSGWARELGLDGGAFKKYSLPYGMGRRILAFFRKVSATKIAFPRKVTVARRDRPGKSSL